LLSALGKKDLYLVSPESQRPADEIGKEEKRGIETRGAG